jgi:hypothetical protein
MGGTVIEEDRCGLEGERQHGKESRNAAVALAGAEDDSVVEE